MFRCVAALSAIILLVRGIAGPFWMMHNPLAAEMTFAVSILCSLLTQARRQEPAVLTPRETRWPPTVLVPLAALFAFLPILPMPLITDDYRHMRHISTGEAPTPFGCLTHPCGGPNFFRPLGFSTFWGEWKLWKTAAMPCHAFDLTLHAVSSGLFLMLVRRLGVAPPFDWLAGLLFAWNGIRPEAVAWPGARFDTLVLLFSLAAALSVLRGGRLGLFGSISGNRRSVPEQGIGIRVAAAFGAAVGTGLAVPGWPDPPGGECHCGDCNFRMEMGGVAGNWRLPQRRWRAGDSPIQGACVG